MRFAHLADCHIGSWREPKLRDISTQAFVRAIDLSIEKKVDFILIAGDLFNTSMPAIDKLKDTVVKLKELKDKEIPVYAIAGSHDYSPSGKTMLDVLEGAGLLHNVAKGEIVHGNLKLKFTVDKKTGAKITGLLGRRKGLEKYDYAYLLKDELERENGYKIFMFHSALTDLMPKNLEAMYALPLSFLPRGFDYYSGGHVHIVKSDIVPKYGRIAYPGPLFPNSFSEIEELGSGGFYIVEDDKVEWHRIEVHGNFSISVDCNDKTPEDVAKELRERISGRDFFNTIVTVRLGGCLKSGNVNDIGIQDVIREIYAKSAYFVMKNSYALTTKEFEKNEIKATSTVGIEDELVKKLLGQIKIKGFDLQREEELIKSLMEILNKERDEGERVADFENRIRGEIGRLLGL